MPIAAFGVSDKVHKWQSTEHALLRAASERSGDGPVELRAGPRKVLIARRDKSPVAPRRTKKDPMVGLCFIRGLSVSATR